MPPQYLTPICIRVFVEIDRMCEPHGPPVSIYEVADELFIQARVAAKACSALAQCKLLARTQRGSHAYNAMYRPSARGREVYAAMADSVLRRSC